MPSPDLLNLHHSEPGYGFFRSYLLPPLGQGDTVSRVYQVAASFQRTPTRTIVQLADWIRSLNVDSAIRRRYLATLRAEGFHDVERAFEFRMKDGGLKLLIVDWAVFEAPPGEGNPWVRDGDALRFVPERIGPPKMNNRMFDPRSELKDCIAKYRRRQRPIVSQGTS